MGGVSKFDWAKNARFLSRVLLFGTDGHKARTGTLLQSASTPVLLCDPPCGLLEPAEVYSIGPLQCRPRYRPQHRVEEILSGRCVLSKSPTPWPFMGMQKWNAPIRCPIQCPALLVEVPYSLNLKGYYAYTKQLLCHNPILNQNL